MDRTIAVNVAASCDQVFAVVSDLSTFPDWLDLVNRVEPAPAHASDPGPPFAVTLRASVGPLARSKRLRMCRTELDPAAGRVRFDRHETDGREHAVWAMTTDVSGSDAGGSRVAIRLRYDGRMWSSMLDGVLDVAIKRATRRLEARAGG